MEYEVDFNKKLPVWQTMLLILGALLPAIAYVTTVYFQTHQG